MHQYQERYGEEDRKQGGTTRVNDIWKVWVKGNHSGDPRWWEKPEEKTNADLFVDPVVDVINVSVEGVNLEGCSQLVFVFSERRLDLLPPDNMKH